MRRLLLIATALGATLLARAAGASVPECVYESCISDNGCSFSACYPAPTTTVYYVCDCQTGTHADSLGYAKSSLCVAGNDTTGTGTTSSPFQTFEKGRSLFAGLPALGQIRFCKGGMFTEGGNSTFINTNATSTNRVVVASYSPPWGNGTEGRPVINVPPGQYGLSTVDGSGDTEEGYIFAGLAIVGSGTPTSAGTLAGLFVYNVTNYVDACDMEFADTSLGVQAGGANAAEGKNEHIHVRNSYFHDLEGQGVLMGDDDYSTTYSCFVNNGFGRVTFNHHGYYGGNTDASTGGSAMVFSHNDLYKGIQIGPSCVGSPCAGATCQGAEFVAHGRINGLTIQYNYIREDSGVATGGCYGLGLAPGYSSQDSTDNLDVSFNVIVNVGQNPIQVAATHIGKVYGNLIWQANGQNDVGVAATDDGVNTGQGDYHNQDITITGNDVTVDLGQGVGMAAAMTRGIATNNSVVMTASSGTAYCFKYDQSTGSYTKINNNLCYGSGAATLRWESSTGDTFSAWKTATSFDLNSLNATSPLYTNFRLGTFAQMTGGDFIPQSGSPLRAAGDNATKYTVDYAGLTAGNPPDIGAFQYTSGVLPTGKPASEIFIFVSSAADHRHVW